MDITEFKYRFDDSKEKALVLCRLNCMDTYIHNLLILLSMHGVTHIYTPHTYADLLIFLATHTTHSKGFSKLLGNEGKF